MGHRLPIQPADEERGQTTSRTDPHCRYPALSAQYASWGTGAYDFDNDGRADLFVAHGGLIHLIPQEHSVFRNLGNFKFEDVIRGAGAILREEERGARGCFRRLR